MDRPASRCPDDMPSFRPLISCALALASLGAVAPTAAEAGVSSWTKWIQGDPTYDDAWVRSFAQDGTSYYAGTEDDGVFRSTNAGVTWTRASSGLDEVPGGRNVRVVFNDGGTLLAGTSAGLFKGAGGGWSPLAQGPEPAPGSKTKLNKGVQDLERVGGTLLAGVHSGGVYTSGDAGATWKPPAPGNGMVAAETVWDLTRHPITPNLVLAATTSGVYRSTDGGTSWELRNDGLPSTITLRVVADQHLPNVYYVGTTGNGVYRTVDAGQTWQPINAGLGFGNLTVRGIFQVPQLPGSLYAATGNGLYVTHNADVGDWLTPRWRKVTNAGLGASAEMWALADFFFAPGTIGAGTHGNGGGGFHMQVVPPVNQSAPTISGTTAVGRTLTANAGTWQGTPDIVFTYQWEVFRNGGWSAIPGATKSTYVLTAEDKDDRVRVRVFAENPFPLPEPVEAVSAQSAVIAANPGSLPGSQVAGSPTVQDPDGTPQPGEVVTAVPPTFTPAATSWSYAWYRCDFDQIDDCTLVPTQTDSTFTLTHSEVGHRMRAKAIGSNADGSKTSDLGGASNLVFPPDPVNVEKPTVSKNAWIGQSMVSTAGTWADPSTKYSRRWMRCNAQGQSCEYLPDTGVARTVVAADLGKTLKVEVKGDPNGGNQLPAPVWVESAVSPVVVATDPNPPAPDPVAPQPQQPGAGDPPVTPQGQQPQGQQPGPQPQGQQPQADALAPALGRLSFSTKAFKLTVSERSTVTVTIAKVRPGRRAKGTCVRPTAKLRKAKRCDRLTTVQTLKATGQGALSLKLKGKLPKGRYRASVVARDLAGNATKPRTLDLRVRR